MLNLYLQERKKKQSFPLEKKKQNKEQTDLTCSFLRR